MFAILDEGNATISVKATLDEQRSLIASDPAAYSPSPYVGRFGWVLVELRKADAAEVEELIVEAWRLTAPKRMVKAFDESGGQPQGQLR